MNPCAVSLDLARYDRKCCEEDARLDWLEGEARLVEQDWRNELENGEGIILELGIEWGDIKLLAEENKIDPYQQLNDLAYDWVVDNEAEILQRYNELQWD